MFIMSVLEPIGGDTFRVTSRLRDGRWRNRGSLTDRADFSSIASTQVCVHIAVDNCGSSPGVKRIDLEAYYFTCVKCRG
jgi:hypothetical protein